MAYLAPGNRSQTAWAMTWAVEWRRTYRPSSVLSVTTATVAPSVSGVPRSTSRPSTVAATAALASPLPIDDARSAAVAPSGSALDEPSGKVTLMSAIVGRGYWRRDHPLRDGRALRIPRRASRRRRRTDRGGVHGRDLARRADRDGGLVRGGQDHPAAPAQPARRPRCRSGAARRQGRAPVRRPPTAPARAVRRAGTGDVPGHGRRESGHGRAVRRRRRLARTR